MCGNHHHDGTPIDHHHEPRRQVFYPNAHPRSRRAFLGNLGKGSMAMAVITPTLLAACSTSADSGSTVASGEASQSDPTPPAAAPAPTEPGASEPGPTAPSQTEGAAPAETAAGDDLGPVTWARAQLGFVSAYVLARGNTAAIVDTGTPGSAAAIGETLAGLGLNYGDVAHVILTHSHSDHAGSISEVLAQAPNAVAYAGEADLGGIDADLVGLAGGEDVFGFEMLPTPGHTPGHIAVIDHQAGLLVAGDAIFTEGGGVIEGPERFFDDIPESRESIRAMAALTFNTLLVGHGDPIEFAADSAVAGLAASF